jgi:Mn2+/Fe2+ NRAMP family transporter
MTRETKSGREIKQNARRKSLSATIQVVVSLTVIVSIILVAAASIITFKNMLDEKSEVEARTALNVVEETFSAQVDMLFVYAQILLLRTITSRLL